MTLRVVLRLHTYLSIGIICISQLPTPLWTVKTGILSIFVTEATLLGTPEQRLVHFMRIYHQPMSLSVFSYLDFIFFIFNSFHKKIPYNYFMCSLQWTGISNRMSSASCPEHPGTRSRLTGTLNCISSYDGWNYTIHPHQIIALYNTIHTLHFNSTSHPWFSNTNIGIQYQLSLHKVMHRL